MLTLQMLAVLFAGRLRILRNSWLYDRHGKRVGILRLIVLPLLMLAGLAPLMFFSFIATFGLTSTLSDPDFLRLLNEVLAEQQLGLPTDVERYLQTLPSLGFFVALLLLIFSGFASMLNGLYLANDMDMLIVAPIPSRAVFIYKFFGALGTQYGLLLVLLLPALIGFGAAMAYGSAYYLMILPVLALLPLLPAGLGSLLVMLVLRLMPPRRARDIVTVVGGLVGAGFYLATVTFRVEAIEPNPDLLRTLLIFDNPLLPSSWAGRSIVAAGAGDWPAAAFFGGLLGLVALTVFSFCVWLAERTYYAGLSDVASATGGTRKSRSSRPLAERRPGWLARLLPAQSYAIMIKDLLLFRRDLTSLQGVMFPLLLAGFWTYQILRDLARGDLDNAPGGGQGFVTIFGLLIATVLCQSLANALAGAGLGREQRTLWLLKIAPVSIGRLMIGKLALAYLPYLTVGPFFVIGLGLLRAGSPLLMIAEMAVLLMLGLGAVCVTFGLGAFFPRLNETDPRRQVSTRASLLSSLFYMVYTAALLFLTLGLVGLASLIISDAGILVTVAVAGWFLAICVTVAAVWLGVWLGRCGLERIEL
jgi:ABC-2 type transport system permease protein